MSTGPLSSIIVAPRVFPETGPVSSLLQFVIGIFALRSSTTIYALFLLLFRGSFTGVADFTLLFHVRSVIISTPMVDLPTLLRVPDDSGVLSFVGGPFTCSLSTTTDSLYVYSCASSKVLRLGRHSGQHTLQTFSGRTEFLRACTPLPTLQPIESDRVSPFTVVSPFSSLISNTLAAQVDSHFSFVSPRPMRLHGNVFLYFVGSLSIWSSCSSISSRAAISPSILSSESEASSSFSSIFNSSSSSSP